MLCKITPANLSTHLMQTSFKFRTVKSLTMKRRNDHQKFPLLPQNAITHIFEMAAGPVRELFGIGPLGGRTEDNDVMEGEDATDSSVTTTKEDAIEGMKYLAFEPKIWVPPCSLLSFRYFSTARTRRRQ